MKNRKKNTKLVLILLLVCITLGYAALRTGLNINGTTNVSSASWNVHFENYQMSNATNITPTTEPVITGTTTTSISYEVDLDVPGDIYEFSVEVVNGGSIDALISLVSKYNGSEIGPGNTIPEYIEYTVTDGNGDEIVDGHRLNHGNREIVKVAVKYKEDASVLPSQDATLRFDIEIEATQAPKPQPSRFVYTANLHTVEDTKISIGETIPSGIDVYQTADAARAAFYNTPYYLKHKLNNNNEVEETYIGFIINNDIKQQLISDNCYNDIDWDCVNAGGTEDECKILDQSCADEYNSLVNGTYELRSGINESLLPEQPVYENNKNIMKTAYNYANNPSVCEYIGISFTCEIHGVRAVVNDFDTVTAFYAYISNVNGLGCASGRDNDDISYSYCFEH